MAKKWDGDGVPLAESNCAEIGTEADKAARKAAAETEAAWKGVGQKPGLLIWRIEAFKVVPWDKSKYGKFHEGDSYIILETLEGEGKGKEQLTHHIYFWLGAKTSIDEMGTAAYKTVELDDLMDGEPTQSREVMGHESQQFKKLFAHITYLEGGVDSGFRSVGAGIYQARLLQVRKTKHGTVCTEVTLGRESLNQGDCFILDAEKQIYVWDGENSSPMERFQANIRAEKIESERHGVAKATHELDDEFWALLGGRGTLRPASEGTDKIPEAQVGEGVLYRLSDASGTLVTTVVGRGSLKKSMLDSNDVMLLDHGAEISLWVGRGASEAERRNAYPTAMNYLRGRQDRHTKVPIHMYKEGGRINNPLWETAFSEKVSGPTRKATFWPCCCGA